MTHILSAETIVLIAGVFFTLGYLIIHQVLLRVMLLMGTAFYVVYYATVGPAPLWEAIYVSSIMGLANLIGLTNLLLRRSTFCLPAAHRDIYPRFSHMMPGDFRALMKLADRRVLCAPEQVTQQDHTTLYLTYVIRGSMEVEKSGEFFILPEGLFAGELAYLNNQTSVATTWVREGSEIVQWPVTELRRYAARRDRFRHALEGMIGKDLATKVTAAVAPRSLKWRSTDQPSVSFSSSRYG